MAIASLAVVVAGVWGLYHVSNQVRAWPEPEPGIRYEPPPRPGVQVQTPYGPGVVVRPVAYLDGPMWQVRLETGRHVVLRRVEMVVRRPEE